DYYCAIWHNNACIF
nr:immunoglobulin light chain junction region [Macaca mulatta]